MLSMAYETTATKQPLQIIITFPEVLGHHVLTLNIYPNINIYLYFNYIGTSTFEIFDYKSMYCFLKLLSYSIHRFDKTKRANIYLCSFQNII